MKIVPTGAPWAYAPRPYRPACCVCTEAVSISPALHPAERVSARLWHLRAKPPPRNLLHAPARTHTLIRLHARLLYLFAARSTSFVDVVVVVDRGHSARTIEELNTSEICKGWFVYMTVNDTLPEPQQRYIERGLSAPPRTSPRRPATLPCAPFRSAASDGVVYRSLEWGLAERHSLMFVCTTTGNLRNRFSKRPRQTGMYHHYGPCCGHDSAPQWGPNSGLADARKKNRSLEWGLQVTAVAVRLVGVPAFWATTRTPVPRPSHRADQRARDPDGGIPADATAVHPLRHLLLRQMECEGRPARQVVDHGAGTAAVWCPG